ncbi:hypothetical protein [Xanthovirga aplysinae]|uniref:hypothetical protein n=1 Tax=Xanthovirga aplysinae TaxID=2529853 RepID=UPI0012BD53B4|nr:hypothetical protein [Xanthovirga aplysinae]MTI29946.1 hypothetical protein [Xanthovirga aplysinae]
MTSSKKKISELSNIVYNQMGSLSLRSNRFLQSSGFLRKSLLFSLFGGLLSILLAQNSHAQISFEPTSEWKVVKESKKVQLMSRWIVIGDSLKTRQIRIKANVKADVSDILYCLRSEEALNQWKKNARKFEVLDEKEGQWVFYTEFAIPRLFPQQDLVLQYQVKEEAEKTLVDAYSIPDYLDRTKKVKRQEKYEEHWVIRPIDGENVEVDFSSMAPTKPLLPRSVQDKFIHPMLINSFAELKSQAEKRTLKRANEESTDPSGLLSTGI